MDRDEQQLYRDVKRIITETSRDREDIKSFILYTFDHSCKDDPEYCDPEEGKKEGRTLSHYEMARRHIAANVDTIYDYAESPIEILFLCNLLVTSFQHSPFFLTITAPVTVDTLSRTVTEKHKAIQNIRRAIRDNGGELDLKHLANMVTVHQELKALIGLALPRHLQAIGDSLIDTMTYLEQGLGQSFHVSLQPSFEHVRVDDKRIRPDMVLWIPTHPQFKMIVECDGYDFHSDKETFAKDRVRDRILQQQGYQVFRFSGREIVANATQPVNEFIEYLFSLDEKFGLELEEAQKTMRTFHTNYDEKEELPASLPIDHDGEIWLTAQHRTTISKPVPDELTCQKYLESVYDRYSSVKLPLGPEGFSLHAIFQPLELCRDPLAAEDLNRKQRHPFLGEDLEGEKGADCQHSRRDRREHAEEKEQPVIAKNGDDALNQSPQRRLVILGGPGTGKTTTLKYFVGCRAKEALADPNAPIPIFLSLADLARSQKTLQDYLVELVGELDIERTYADTLWKAIKTEQAFVCLDSLDEVEPQRRQKMIGWVNEWATKPGNTWVIGSRFTEYKGGSFKYGQFAEWELLPMSHQLRLELSERLLPELQRVFSSVPAKSLSPATFVKLLEDHSQAAWGGNPLLFSLAAVVFWKVRTLPSSRAMLYQQVLDAILETHELDPVRRKILRRVLSDLALELYKTKGRTFSQDNLLELLPLVRQRQHENWITEDMVHRIVASGMLDILTREIYSFRHQTFQEYLAAVELAQRLTHHDQTIREETWKFVWNKRTYSYWTEVLRLMVGVLGQQLGNRGQAQARRWLHELIEQRSTKEGDPGDLGLALALKSLTEVTEENEWEAATRGPLQKRIVAIWLDELLKATRDQRRTKQERLQSLVREVSHLRGQEVDEILGPLLEALRDQHRDVRQVAVQVLGALGKRVPVSQLLPALHADYWEVRQAAVQILGALEEIVPVDQLLPALHADYWEVRQAAVQILGAQGERVPMDQLLPALHDDHRKVRQAAVQVLGALGKRMPVDQLLPALQDLDKEVRYAAVQVLGAQGERVSIDQLLPALHDSVEDVRQAAVQVLGAQGERVPMDQLLPALHDDHRKVRQAAVQVLCAQGERVPVDQLFPALHNPDENVRLAAVQVLGALGERVPMDQLLSALHDYRWKVRLAAVQILGAQGGRVPVDQLLPALHDLDEDVRQAAVQVLGAQGERVPVDQLLPALHDPIEDVRLAAVQVLGAQGERVPVDQLLPALHDDHWKVRQAAVQVLGIQGERVPVGQLLPALHDPDKEVRQAAVQILGAQGERVPVDQLFPALHDLDQEVRYAAVQVLGAQGGRVPVDQLLPALHDDHWKVRLAAVQVLVAQGERVPVDQLLPALHNPDKDVRLAAVQVLGTQGERVPVDQLLPALHDDHWKVRHATVQVLCAQGERVPVDQLLPALHNPDKDVRQAAVQVLKALGEKVPVDQLLPALHDDHRKVRQAAVQVLCAQGERVPVDQLLPALHNPDEDVRQAAVQVLCAQGERVPVDQLPPALHDDHRKVRQAAVRILEVLGEREPVDPLFPLDEDVRQAAVRILGAQGERVPVDQLLPALHDPDENVRQAAVQVLGAQGERVPVDQLLPALHDPDENVRQAAVQVLGAQGERVPVDQLLPALHDPNEWVRQAAVQILGAQGERVPVDQLLPILHDNHWGVRQAAVQILEAQGERVPVDQLLPALHDPDEDVRQAAVQILGAQGERVPVDQLLPILHDNHWGVRQAAVQILGAQGERVPVDQLLPALHDPDEDVRQAVVQVLEAQGERVPVDQLLPALHDPDEDVRQAAVQVLGALGEKVPVDQLLPALHDPDEDVRQAAVQVLGAQGERVPVDLLLEAVGDVDNNVNNEAIKVLSQIAPHSIDKIANEAIAILNGQPFGFVLGSIIQTSLCQTVGEMKLALPAIFDELTKLLIWPHWQVRSNAAKALGSIRRNIPDAAIRRLLELRLHDPVQVVREAADDALAEILSLETGIEDD